MKVWHRFGLASLVGALVLMAGQSSLRADPVADHLNTLIAELEVRSVALAGSTDRDERKQKKAIDKVLKAFSRPSASLAKDLKTAAKAIKKLAKVFPAEFSPGPPDLNVLPGALVTTLEGLATEALSAYVADILALRDQAQVNLDSALPGKCQDKAQRAVDRVQADLEKADNAPDYGRLAKSLARAAKNVIKSAGLADLALACLPDHDLPSLGSTLSMAVDGVAVELATDAIDPAPGVNSIHGSYSSVVQSFYLGVGAPLEPVPFALQLEVLLGSNPNGPDPVTGTFVHGGNLYEIVSGGATILSLTELPGHVLGTFEFEAVRADDSEEPIIVTDGRFIAWSERFF